MIHVTYDDYDTMLELFEEVRGTGELKPFWPTVPQIDLMCENPRRFIKFACYLYETNPDPKNPAEKYSKKNLSAFINEHLELVDRKEAKGS